ncbi:glycosyltransferase family 2 protein [Occallatibacter savannae]|uniref:glycosyltransferase family 2 protein n=1 Tax=Occallatibacter savannae TaxID=1002691 RepID=UPI000D68C362|nr:glycosyltransferase family 2 protein [Occallatibacter savannae]
MKISIVTISFNQAKFLTRTIESVLQQESCDIEYIIVDPGSTDGSRAIIDGYRSHLHRAIFEPDNGPADGLNKGFTTATGEVFAFLNSDDILYPGAVSAAKHYLSQHPKIDVVSGNANVIGPDDRVYRVVYSDRFTPYKYVYGGAVLIQPSTFFRRSAFERAGGFNSANRATWDGELFFDMARAGCKFGRCNQIWSGYRLHRDSVTASKRLQEGRNLVQKRNFRELMNRDPNRWDRTLNRVFQFWKHLSNPRDTIERVLRGPVFGRSIDDIQL